MFFSHLLIFFKINFFKNYFRMCLFVWFDSLRLINNHLVIKGRVFLGWTSTKLGLMILLKDHNAVMQVRLKPAAPQSRVKHSTTEPLRSNSFRNTLWVSNRLDPDQTSFMTLEDRELMVKITRLNALVTINCYLLNHTLWIPCLTTRSPR